MKILTILLLNALFLFGFSQVDAQVVSIDKDKKILTLDKKFLKGVSGVVMHQYDENHSAIVATVVSKGSNRAKIEYIDYVENDRLPTISTKPQEGDRVIMGYLYDRSLLIAPNKSTYDEVVKLFDAIDFINPDLLVFDMMRSSQKMPTPESIREFSQNNAVGLVYIAVDDRGYFLDANSFELLSTNALFSTSEESELPFYMQIEGATQGLISRIGGFFSSIFRSEDSKIKNDYDRYYLQMIGE